MDVEELARRLEPLMPARVKRWMKVYAAGDQSMRAVIEQQIRLTAERTLGSAHMLLSLPPERAVRGVYNLGTVLYEREKWPAGLTSTELLQGVGIFGRSGGGKTNAVFHLLLQLSERGVPFLFLDWKRTGRHLAPSLGSKVRVYTPGRSLSPFTFNPFQPPPGFEPAAYAGLVADQLATAYTLGDGAVGLLQRSLQACYARYGSKTSLPDVIQELEQMTGHARLKGWQASALRALRSLESALVTGSSEAAGNGADALPDQLDSVASLLRQSTILELDALPQGAKRFLVPLLGLWIYHGRLAAADRERLRFVLVVEEAHHVLYTHSRSQESVMEMVLRQCRELGIGVIVVDQHPHLISSAALGNTYATICFNLKDPADSRRAASLTLVDQPGCFGGLPVGHAVVRLSDRWRRPFLVRFPKVAVDKGSMTDQALGGWIAKQAHSAALPAPPGGASTVGGQVRRVPPALRPLRPVELRFLEDVIAFPLDGVKARYGRLGLSGHRGNDLKAALVRTGWLEAQVVPFGQTRKVVLRLSKDAREHLGLPASAAQHESIAHEYWKRHWAQRLADLGYAVTIEAQRTGSIGAADVLGTRDGASVAVEIETGRADAVANVRHGLAAGFNRVVVAATDPAALTAVEAALARAGFLLPPRIELVPAWARWG